MTRPALVLTAFIALSSCGSTTVAMAVAALGVAGVGLETYCASGGSGCSPALLSYAPRIVTEASRDALILESGQATQAQLQQIADNLTLLLAAAAVPGLTPGEQQELSAISAAISVLLPLVKTMISSAGSGPGPLKLPPLSGKDRHELSKMRLKMKAAHP